MGRRRLLISDVDGTLLGDDAALARFAEWYAPRREQLGLVYSSGRFFESVRASVRTTDLPAPDAIIGGVGTDVRLYESAERVGDWHLIHEGWDVPGVRAAVEQFSEIEPQPDEFQSDFKLSYYAHDVSAEFLSEVEQSLDAGGFEVKLVYSSNRDLDVLPSRTGKGNAAKYLADYWNVPHEDVIVSGDSGNDLAMFEQNFRGIVVANAHPELKQLAGDRVYQSPYSYAAGVVDGLEHWLGERL